MLSWVVMEIMLEFLNVKQNIWERERKIERGYVSSLQYKDWNFSFYVNFIGQNGTHICYSLLCFWGQIGITLDSGFPKFFALRPLFLTSLDVLSVSYSVFIFFKILPSNKKLKTTHFQLINMVNHIKNYIGFG